MTPLVLAEPERPFWGFAELFLALASFLAALAVVVEIATRYFHAPAESGTWSVIEELAAYAILFLALRIIFSRHGKGLLESLGWSKMGPFTALSLVMTGLILSISTVVLGYLLMTPDTETQFEKMLADPASRVIVGLFSITMGPIVEELLFRGLLQPVLVNVSGVFPGILLTSVLFGALHMPQYNYIWQLGVALVIVGFVLGTVRHLSGSTKASTIVHIAFNTLPFLALLASGNPPAGK
jgi:membrane protease YdiL (CAAX protease family)